MPHIIYDLSIDKSYCNLLVAFPTYLYFSRCLILYPVLISCAPNLLPSTLCSSRPQPLLICLAPSFLTRYLSPLAIFS